MQSRRNFIGKVASGLAGTLAVSNVLGANERLRLGIIGAGDRGMQIVREAMACPNTDFVAFADIYTKRLEDAKKVAPNAKTYLDHRYLLDDKSIDAVLWRSRSITPSGCAPHTKKPVSAPCRSGTSPALPVR